MSMTTDLPKFSDPVALFPLPNVVLLPGATLPLQVHEPRYRAMVRDVLDDDAIIAMALLCPGYEAYYYTNLAEIRPVVCVGRIQECVQIPGDCYFINLRGLCRARVRQEDRNGEYRLAMLDPMVRPETGIEVDGEYAARQDFREMLGDPAFDAEGEIERIRILANSSAPLHRIVDRIAAELLPGEAVEIKQQILEEMNVLRRAATLIRELRLLHRMLEKRQEQHDEWPRLGSMN